MGIGRAGRTTGVSFLLLAVMTSGLLAVVAAPVAPAGAAGKARHAGHTTLHRTSGVLTMAEDLTGSDGDPVTFDVAQSHTPGDQIPWDLPVYDTLLRYTPSGSLVPELARSATIVNSTTIDVALRAGVVFSDGTPFDASAVRAGLLRNEQAPQHGQFDSALYDVSSIDVTSPTELVIHLSSPVAGAFYPLLAGEESFIPSPAGVAKGNLATHPVGAGPFVLERYVPDQEIVLAKNPTYWDAKAIKIEELRLLSVPGGPQQLSALESGQVNLATELPTSDIPALRSSSSLVLGIARSPTSNLWMPLCKSSGPLAKVGVRKALNYAVDRKAISQALLEGEGSPQWALWPPKSIYYPKSLTGIYTTNVPKAKRLLRAAGYAKGFHLTLVQIPGNPLADQVAQVVQQEWKRIGVTLSLLPSTNFTVDLYQHHRGQTSVLPTERGGIEKLDGSFRSGSFGDLCNYDNPTLDKLADELAMAAPTGPTAVHVWKKAQALVAKNALAVWLDWIPVVNGWARQVSRVDMVTSYLLPIPDLWTVQVSH